MYIDTKSDKYKKIINVAKYKIFIAKQINWSLDNLVEYNEKWMNIDELYNCHKIVFEYNELYPRLNRDGIDNIRQYFTIHHFLYYLIKQIVKIFKRTSKRFIEYDIIELIKYNVDIAYEIHLDNLTQKIYDYLYPTTNHAILSNIFYIFKPINMYSEYYGYMKNINRYENFTEYTEYDLLYNLMYCIENKNTDMSIIYMIYFQILENINYYGINITMNDVIELIRCYEKTRTQERLRIYEEELIMKTWHPQRLIDWCLDIEEKSNFVEDNKPN